VSEALAIALDCSAAGAAVREDLRDTHRAILDALRRPGAWFTGPERVAIAGESRRAPHCALCAARKAALSPEQPRGAHERTPAGAGLPAAVVEVAHRVRTDSGRLTRAWFERALASGLGHGRDERRGAQGARPRALRIGGQHARGLG